MTSLFAYRGLIENFVKRDISQKYIGSFFGLYWSVINPVITLIIYVLVFGVFLKVRLPGDTDIWDFTLYFAAGFLPWTAFQTSVMRAATSILDNKTYIKKVPFPCEIFPVYITLSECVNLLICLGIYFAIYVILKGAPTIFILFLPLAILLQMLFTFALAFLLSSGSVYLRDVPQMLGAAFLIWFWATPIAYAVNVIPANFHWIVVLNPAYYMLEIYRDALFYGRIPEMDILIPFAVFSIVFFAVSLWIFQKTKRGFGDLL